MKFQTIENLVHYIAKYVDYLPILLFLVFLPKSRASKGIWIISLSCVFSIAIVTLVRSVSSPVIRHYMISLYTFSEYLFFAIFLYISLVNRLMKRILTAVSVLFFLFLAVYAIEITFSRFDTLPIGIETILVLICSFYFLYEQMNDPKDQFIYQDYRFWVILGMMIYLAGSFFIYIFSEQFNPEEWKKYRFLTYLFYIMKNVFFAIGILVYVKQPKKATSHDKSVPYLDLN